MRLKTALLFLFAFLTFINAYSQECEGELSEKAEKYIEKSKDKKKYDSDERKEFLERALEEDEECMECLQRLGHLYFLRAKNNGTSFGTARRYLEQLTEACPEFHSEPYYELGAINYAEQEYDKALDCFNKFIHFPDDDPEKFTKKYDKQYEDVQQSIPKVAFWQEFYESDLEFAPKKVGGVSSISDEIFPTISPDGEIMFYTRRGEKQAKGDLFARKVEEFSWSKRKDINAYFDQGEALPSPFNQGDSYGASTISVDNKEMYIAVKNPVGSNPENFDLYQTSYDNVYDEDLGKDVYKWTNLEILGPEINTDSGWESQPSLSADGQLLFFATVRAECIMNVYGNPSHDIYYSEKQDDGTWGPAKSIGDVINTKGDEKSPFMHSDSRTLYFASNGHLGRGGMDIFYCKMDDDGNWSKPKNIGHPVNTDEDETGLIVSTDGEEAYFFSKRIRGSGGYDIYSFSLPEKARPEKVVLLKGELKDENDEVLKDARVELKFTGTKDIKEIEVDNNDGRYAAVINVERSENVVMSVKKEGLAFNSRVVVDQKEEVKPSVVKLDVQTHVAKANKPFVINDIYYRTNSAEINEESKLILNEFALYLLDNPKMQIEIRGHTDNLGSDRDNLALSMDRSFEVKGYLQKQGIPGKRILSKGYGETKPVSSNDTEIGRAQNRRTEFVILKM